MKEEKTKLLRWLTQRYKERDKIRRMFFGDEQVNKWQQQIREHFTGDKTDLIIEGDIE